MRGLEGLVRDVLVLDEAHNLATRSDRATAAAALASRARTLVMSNDGRLRDGVPLPASVALTCAP